MFEMPSNEIVGTGIGVSVNSANDRSEPCGKPLCKRPRSSDSVSFISVSGILLKSRGSGGAGGIAIDRTGAEIAKAEAVTD